MGTKEFDIEATRIVRYGVKILAGVQSMERGTVNNDYTFCYQCRTFYHRRGPAHWRVCVLIRQEEHTIQFRREGSGSGRYQQDTSGELEDIEFG